MDTTTSPPTDKPLFLANLKSVMPIKPVWLVVFGALLTVLGVFAFASVVTATIVTVYFVAISMVVAGTAQIALGLQSRSPRGATTWVLLGLLYLGAGLLAFFNPLLAAGVLTLLLGASLVAGGLIRLFLSLQMRSGNQWWWMAVSAAVTLLLGIMVLAQWPASSLYILGVFLSVDLIFAGMAWIMIGTAAISSNQAAGISRP